jgi:broad specificity phosphatase PhoE
MQKTMPRLILVILMVLIIVWLAACTTTVKPVYLLRHAEKGPGSDPDLTPAGQARAQELLRMLENVAVNAIYSTDTNRTRQTAQPLATGKNLTIQIYSGTSVANRILSGSKEQIAVIVGHSDTVPELITAFRGTPPYTHIPGNEFDNLFLLIVKKMKKFGSGTDITTKVLHMKYGSVSD